MADSTTAQIGSRTTLHYWPANDSPVPSPLAWAKIANVRTFGPVGQDRPEVDTTDLDSTGVERIGGLPDGREITISCFANTSTLPTLEYLFNQNQTIDLKMSAPAPLSTSRYFSLAPLGITILGQIAPNEPEMVELRGRISGDIVSADTHA